MPSLAIGVSVNSVPVMAGAHGTPTAPTGLSVEIDGPGQAGEQHTAVLSYDDPQPYPPPVRTFQWKRDGVAILGATSASYTPVDTFALTVTVSVENASGSDGPATSAAVNLKPGYTDDPVISTATSFEVGEELTVSTPTTIGQVSSVTYTWKADGVVRGTGNTFTPAAEDEGKTITAEVTLTNAAGATVAIADPVFVFFGAPGVTITDITDGGFTDLTVFSVDFDTTGEIASTAIAWYSAADPNTILATGNDVTFAAAVADLKARVTVTNPSGISASDESDETAVVQQSVAPSVSSATIDRGGEEVAPGTVLTAEVVATGSPATLTTSIQWLDNGSPISGATSPVYTIGAVTGPITYSYVVSNGVEPDATGSSSDSVTVAVDNAPTLDLSSLSFTLADTDPIATDDLTARGTNLTGGVWTLDLEEASDDGTESIAFETGDYAFIDYKALFVGATQWTATGTSQSANPFTGSPAALPTGFANSEQAGVLRAADTVADGSYSVKLWAGDGTNAVSITATLVGAAPGAATVPPAPPAENWTLTDAGDGRLAITVVSPFPDGGSTNTDREYEVNDSDTWVSFGVTGNGTFYIPAASLIQNQSNSVKLRSTNAEGVGAESTAKTATPTGATAPITLTVTDDFPVWTGTGLASLTVTDDFPIWSAS